MMAVCVHCNGLEFAELFQEESRQLFWIAKDISVLNENLNEELEEFSNKNKEHSYDDSLEYVEDFLDVKTEWLEREDELQGTLASQLSHLCQDFSYIHHLRQQQPQHHWHGPHVPCQLWGHSTQRWHPPSTTPARARKTRRSGHGLPR
jgi:hypothetical protein